MLATSCEELTYWKRPWCWEGLGAVGEGDDRGWDGWMASPTQWAWVWVNSGSWWWTGRPGLLHSMGSQRVRHERLKWTELIMVLSNSLSSSVIGTVIGTSHCHNWLAQCLGQFGDSIEYHTRLYITPADCVLMGLNHRHLFLESGGWKAEFRVPVWSGAWREGPGCIPSMVSCWHTVFL